MSAFLSHRDAARHLSALLKGTDVLVAPGAFDCLSAQLVEAASFPAVYMTGFGTAASLLGRPDVGLLGMSEMVNNARRMARAVSVPVIADADTGYGNALNTIRTVQAYEDAGVAAIHLEDQIAPKRCGHLEGKQVVPASEMVAKIRAAVAARRSPEFAIIARTDARAVEGLERAIERAHRYRDAGADMLFVEAPQSEIEIETIAHSLRGIPLLFNWAEGGKTPPIELRRLRELGFKVVIFPLSTLLVAARAMREVLTRVRVDGTPASSMSRMIPFNEFVDFIGLPEVRDIERRFSSKDRE
jgi:2-methylisocitrate lyase-like PEP mutase family enzyme